MSEGHAHHAEEGQKSVEMRPLMRFLNGSFTRSKSEGSRSHGDIHSRTIIEALNRFYTYSGEQERDRCSPAEVEDKVYETRALPL